MALKDRSLLIKQYAFVSVENYSIVGTGETIDLALRDYQLGLKNSGISTGGSTTAQLQTATGVVLRVASEVDGGETSYKLLLEDRPGQIFIIPAMVSDELALTREGDRVRIEYSAQEGLSNQSTAFDNLSLPDA